MGRLPVPIEEPRRDNISETIAGALRRLECGRSSSFTYDFHDQHFSADPIIAAQAQADMQHRQQKEPFEFPGYFDQEAFENVNDELDAIWTDEDSDFMNAMFVFSSDDEDEQQEHNAEVLADTTWAGKCAKQNHAYNARRRRHK